jgi:hypothetical protein
MDNTRNLARARGLGRRELKTKWSGTIQRRDPLNALLANETLRAVPTSQKPSGRRILLASKRLFGRSKPGSPRRAYRDGRGRTTPLPQKPSRRPFLLASKRFSTPRFVCSFVAFVWGAIPACRRSRRTLEEGSDATHRNYDALFRIRAHPEIPDYPVQITRVQAEQSGGFRVVAAGLRNGR